MTNLPEDFWFKLPSSPSKEVMDKWMDGQGFPSTHLTNDSKFRINTYEYLSNGTTRYKTEIYSTSSPEIMALMTTGIKEEAIASHYGAKDLLDFISK